MAQAYWRLAQEPVSRAGPDGTVRAPGGGRLQPAADRPAAGPAGWAVIARSIEDPTDEGHAGVEWPSRMATTDEKPHRWVPYVGSSPYRG